MSTGLVIPALQTLIINLFRTKYQLENWKAVKVKTVIMKRLKL